MNNFMTADASQGLDRLIIDWAAVLDRFGGDEDLLREIVAIFLEEYPSLAANIRKALGDADARSVESAAHTLKGSISTFGARAATQTALELEIAGRRGDLERASALADQLDVELVVLDKALRAPIVLRD
jgi:two-component system, sensor histidine kinase and response regulator